MRWRSDKPVGQGCCARVKYRVKTFLPVVNFKVAREIKAVWPASNSSQLLGKELSDHLISPP